MSFLSSRSRLVAVAAAIAFTITMPLVATAPASAHDELLGSTPESGETLSDPPERVSLTFSDDVLTMGAVVLVVDSDETNWVEGEATVDGSDVTVALRPALPDGAYEVRWRVVSTDGHPITGVVPFAVGEVAADADPSATPGAEEEPPSEASSSTPPESTDASDEASATAGPGGDVWRTVLFAGGGALVALAIWLVLLAMRRRRTRATMSTTGTLPDEDTSKESR